jgi:Protein kinase domain
MRTDDDNLTLGPSAVVSPRADSRRFAPGSIIAGRYRLIALLGKGGMGEVYRAEDLTLDQQVALKFLPERTNQHDAAALAQFHNELRVARQVSHKNVCRLYDIGEADGRRFLTMEYVDGEDLASLLRRIGRIPQDKAIDIARQICAGLGAAHDRGVLHRDLKPANVMLDGDGNVRLTDFGLARRQADGPAWRDASEILAGTPQYMAPEQLAGQPTTIKSDIYALGLVLFEIFTGRRAHDATTLHELKQLHESGATVTPSSIVRDLDPSVERAILRCVDRDPDRRPPSALAVAAALPGGDPLAEALAAGETPSPELLVVAAEADALPLWKGVAIVAATLVALAGVIAIAMRASFVRLGPLDKPPAVLIDRAEQLLTSLGYTEPRADAAYGFSQHLAYLLWIPRVDDSPRRWAVLAEGNPSAVAFWYRTSPRAMMSTSGTAIPFTVGLDDPPARDTNSHLITLDAQGRLIQFRSTPIQFEPSPPAAIRTPPWQVLFDAAGLTMSGFAPVAPQWTPPDFGDVRAAWQGPLDGRPDVTMRVEAAAYHDRPVYFVVLGPWNVPTRMLSSEIPLLQQILNTVYRLGIISLMLSAVFLARRNTRERRSDMKGATRFAVVSGFVLLAGAIVGGHHVTNVIVEYNGLVGALMSSTWQAIVLWAVYLALEPYVRKFWPDMLLGWSRLLSGRVRDARVGREVLAGVACGVAFVFIQAARLLLPPALGYPAPRPMLGGEVDVLLGDSSFARLVLALVFREVGLALIVTLIFVACRLIARRPMPAVALGMLVMFYAWSSLGNPNALWLEILLEIAAVAVLALVTIRFGLLASAVALFVAALCEQVPLTFHAAHWSATASNWTLTIVVALTMFGFYAARAGQPVFGSLLAMSPADARRSG